MKHRISPNASCSPRAISLYTGVGGLDLGFEAAGFETAAAVEMDKDCCTSLRANRSWTVIERSIFDTTTHEILDAAKARQGDIDIVIGGPPCQPFSKSGYWAHGDSRRLADARASTLGAYMRVVEEALPKAFLLENVEGIAYSGKSEGLELLLDMVEEINKRSGTRYLPSYRVLCAADYGVPQVRYRMFVIAGREGQRFRFPAPTHRPRDASPSLVDLEPYRTAWDALADVQPDPEEDLAMRGKWADLLPSIPEGENYLWHTERGGGLPLFGWRRRFWCFLLKLAKDRPSWTLQAQPGPGTGPFHWKNRRLGMRELCRLQTFPDDVIVRGTHRAIHRQVGNAVPSLLAEVIAREIRHQLLGLPEIAGPPILIPPNRSPAPSAETVAQVPRRFHKLIGDHEAHPGTGRGYRAMHRTAEIEEV